MQGLWQAHLSEVIYGIKYKFGGDNKKCETCRIKCKYCDCFPECTNFSDNFCVVTKFINRNLSTKI